MQVVHQGPNDLLAIALEKAFSQNALLGPRPSQAPKGGILEALMQRPAPRPQKWSGLLEALAGQPEPQHAPQRQPSGLLGYAARGLGPEVENALSGQFYGGMPADQYAPGFPAQPQQFQPARGGGPALQTFEIQSQDGAVYEVQAPDQQSALDGFTAYSTRSGGAQSGPWGKYGGGSAAASASFDDIVNALRKADDAGDTAAAAQLAQMAREAKARESQKAPIEVEGPDGTIYEFPAGTDDATMTAAMRRAYPPTQQAASSNDWWKDAPLADDPRNAVPQSGRTLEQEQALALASARRRRAEAQAGEWWKDAPLADGQQPAQSATPAEPQIVGGVIMPPAVPASGSFDYAQPSQRGLLDHMRHGSDAVGDAALSAAAGASRGVTGLLDLPGALVGGMGSLAARGVDATGLAPDGFTQGMRDSFGMMPMGDGDLMRGTAAELSGGATEFRGETTAGKYAGTVGEFLPGALLFGGANPGNALRYGVLPGMASEAAGQVTEGTPYEPWARAGAALAAAPAANMLESGARKLISPNGGADAGRLALAQVLDDAGVPVSAGQRVGSEALRRKEGMTSGGQALNETQREALTRAALRTTGTDASRATPEVLAETAKRIGAVFDDVARGVDVTPEPATLNALAAANETYRQLAPKGTQAPIIGEVVRNMTGAFRTGQTIPARTLNSWRSNLSKLTTSSDAATRSAAIEALGALDDTLASTLTRMGRADDVARLATAREQWRNFLAIQKAASGAGENAAAGILSPSALRNAVVGQGRAAYAQGNRGDLGALARAGEGILKELPNSGTAQNLRALGVPSAIWTAAGATAGFQAGGTPMAGLLGLLAGHAAPGVMGAARMSAPVQGWLGNQAVSPFGSLLTPNALAPVPSALSTINKR